MYLNQLGCRMLDQEKHQDEEQAHEKRKFIVNRIMVWIHLVERRELVSRY